MQPIVLLTLCINRMLITLMHALFNLGIAIFKFSSIARRNYYQLQQQTCILFFVCFSNSYTARQHIIERFHEKNYCKSKSKIAAKIISLQLIVGGPGYYGSAYSSIHSQWGSDCQVT